MSGNQENTRQPDPQDPGALLERIQAGDPEPYGELLDRYRPRLVSIAAGIVGVHGAEDVVQNVAEQTLPKVGKFEDRGGGIMSWLTVSTRYAAYKTAAYEKRRQKFVPTDPSDCTFQAQPDDGPTPEETTIETESLERVRAALSKLPPLYAELLEAVYIDGQQLFEYGRSAELPNGTVSGRHARAKVLLRRLIERGEVHLER
jgi:RNA polymerase sigma factor (sigma-70 family)